MADGKKSFVLYADLIHTVEKMPDEIAGKLVKHILAYVNDRNPVSDDLLLNLVFEPIKQQMKRDLDKWEEIREKRIQAGIASAEAKKERASLVNTNQQVSTHVESVQQTSTLSTVSVNGTVTVNGTVSEKKKKEGVTAPHPLIIWINDNAPTIQRLSRPLTNDEASKMLTDLNINTEAKKKALKDMMLSMENYKPLLTKSKSANLTIRKWWAKQAEMNGGTQEQTFKPNIGVYYK